MPQMAPLPWMLLFIFTLTSLFYISTIIFFSLKSMKSLNVEQYEKNFIIKW